MPDTTILTAFLLATASAAAGPSRQELDLNGAWEFQDVDELATPPAGGEWRPCTVPGYRNGTDYRRTWLRRSFTVPEAMRGQRIKVHFGGVKYNSRVYTARGWGCPI